MPEPCSESVFLLSAACDILKTACVQDKVKKTAHVAAWWTHRESENRTFSQIALSLFGRSESGSVPSFAPDRPARPEKPYLLSPTKVPRRRMTRSPKGRSTLLHALAHIELNAIDLAWDMIARFGSNMPDVFFDDWVCVAWEEALHFSLLCHRMESLGIRYGDLPAHDGLWEAAEGTAHDLCARLAVVPMVLEARGLDVTPHMIQQLARVEDTESAAVLHRIHDDEIKHVAIGKKWFEYAWIQAQKTRHKSNTLEIKEAWQACVRTYYKGTIKHPVNIESRDRAFFPQDWYAPLVK